MWRSNDKAVSASTNRPSPRAQSQRGQRGRRGWIVGSLTLWALAAGSLAGALGPYRTTVATFVEPARTEFGGWLAVATNAVTGVTNELPLYELRVDPRAFRAAGLLAPRAGESAAADDRDGWWFDARFRAAGRTHPIQLQLAGDPGANGIEERSWRVRFGGRTGFDGVREMDLVPAPGADLAFEDVARRSARELDLLAPPTGFAKLRVNGADAGTFFWSERGSRDLLERLGHARGTILRRGPDGGPHRADASDADGRVAEARLAELFSLAEEGDAAVFEAAVSRLLDVRKFATWNALAWVLGGAQGVAPISAEQADWYFDPVTGLLEPVASGFGTQPRALAEGALAAAGDEAGLAGLVLALPGVRAARDRVLAGLVSEDGLDLASSLERGMGQLLPRLAGSVGPLPDPIELRRLALVRRDVRQALRHNAEILEQGLALAELGRTPGPALDASGEQDFLADSSLPFERDGDVLRLRAGTHHVASDVVVPAAYRLGLDPGVTLVLDPGVSIVSFRGLLAEGTRRSPIRIIPTDPEKPWGAIGVVHAPEPSKLAYLNVSGGSNAVVDGIELSGQLSFNASDVFLRDSQIHGARGRQAMSVKRSHFEVLRSRFTDNESDGLDAYWSRGEVFASLFAENGDDGLDLARSEVSVRTTTFHGMVDKSISAGEQSRLQVEDSRLVDSGIAITAKDGSRVDVLETEFRRNELVLALYEGKPVFGGGYVSLTGGILVGNVRDFEVETGSGLELNGVVREESVASRALHAVRTPVRRPHAIQ